MRQTLQKFAAQVKQKNCVGQLQQSRSYTEHE